MRAQAADIQLGRHRFVADRSGTLYWPMQRTLIAADLHLEKGAACARRRSLLPPYDTHVTLERLCAAVARHDPERVVALGDSFHDIEGADGLADHALETVRALQHGRDWVWIAGNHDPRLPARLGGRLADELALDGITLRHAPAPYIQGHEIAGHLHPAARLVHGGASIRRKCFASDDARLVLPAMGAYAGGLNVLDAAFASVFGARPLQVWMLGRARVYRVSDRQLAPERANRGGTGPSQAGRQPRR